MKVIGLLKVVNKDMSAFILALIEILYDVKNFMIVLVSHWAVLCRCGGQIECLILQVLLLQRHVPHCWYVICDAALVWIIRISDTNRTASSSEHKGQRAVLQQ